MDRRPKCEYGENCYRKNPDHLKKFSHPSKQNRTEEPKPKKRKIDKKVVQTTLNFFKKGNTKADEEKVKTSPVSDEKQDKNVDNYTIEETKSDVDDEEHVNTQASNNVDDLSNIEYESIIKTMFLVGMPSEFYKFFEFCKSLNEKTPNYALKKFGLELVGAFDVLTGVLDIRNIKDPAKYLCHWRYYYDPPEFQTLLKGLKNYHLGYWRDDPKSDPIFVASNNCKDCVFKIGGSNLFSAVSNYLVNFIKTCDPFTKLAATKLQNKLESFAKENGVKISQNNELMKERQKKVVSKTFHKLGIVVPVEKETELGYRPLIETEANIKKICNVIMSADNDDEREKLQDNLQHLINAANIANDECDFGNSLELGIDLFCMGSDVFHNTIRHLLTTAYSLLNRQEFEQIIRAHLMYRRTGEQLSVVNINT